MSTVMYLITMILGLILFVTAILHLWVCLGANAYKHDSGTGSRKRKYFMVFLHFVSAFVMFYVAAQFAVTTLGF